ncbi:MAG: dipeptidyl-peptidase 3 family protein, partial [Polyangia bacterium]
MRSLLPFVLVVAASSPALAAPFEPVDLSVDLSSLPPNEQRALGKMVEAARIMDSLFLRQAWAGNEPMLLALATDGSPAGRTRLREFVRNKGPWDRLAHDKPFVPHAPPKPLQANFYPADATKGEVEAWMKALPPAERARAVGFYTEIRRGIDGKLMAVPYSVAFGNELVDAGKLLEEAA